VSGSDERFRRDVAAGMNRAFEADETEEIGIDLETARLIIFSDHHKGTRDGADDFFRCERAYHAALAHYLELGYDLYLLGDAEELWENDPEPVLEAYAETLALEAKFQRKGRYLRFWGNHDDLWRYEDQVARHMHSTYPQLEVREALRLRVLRSTGEVGLIFLAHGHQGTAESERFAWLSKFVVRYLWRPLQRRVGFALATPASDWDLRERHEEAMFAWARSRPEKPVLITGHTHRPIFGSSRPSRPRRRPEDEIAAELDEGRAAADPDPAKLAHLHAELELIGAEKRRSVRPPIPIDPPCYFNTGCCSFGDGDCTGIEIADGEIRLVRWLSDEDEPVPKVLVKDRLEDVLAAVRRVPAVPIETTAAATEPPAVSESPVSPGANPHA
jgi:UDP-2,3-diacylglucosamine pyrophosphatase LpxH